MRDKAWYLLMLKGKTMDWAYRFIIDNLKAPSFVYEPQNAYAAYKEVFGIDFASPEQMSALSDKEEIERLKAELELAKIAQKSATVTDEKKDNPSDNKITISDLLTKEQFKSNHSELKGLPLHHAYQRYVKESQVK